MNTFPADDIGPEVLVLLNRREDGEDETTADRLDRQFGYPAAPAANGYEAAMDRMDQARRNCRHARREAERIVREAEDEWTAADANLARFEASPGIPLPEFHEHWAPGEPLVKHCHAAGRTVHEHTREVAS